MLKITELEDKIIRESHLNYEQSIKIYDSMRKEVLALGIIKFENYLDDIEKDINPAKVLNKCISNS